MSEPNSASDPTPPVPPAPSFTYGSAATPVPPAQPSRPLPPPAYGERLPDAPAPAYAAPASGTSAGIPTPPRPRRTWDMVLTIILLVVGLFGMSIGLLYAAIFSDPALVQEVFDEAFTQSGMGGWNGSVGAAPVIIAVSHLLLYVIAVGVSILLLVKNRIAFWVPLTAGAVAAIVFWGTVFAIIFSDPSLMTGAIR